MWAQGQAFRVACGMISSVTEIDLSSGILKDRVPIKRQLTDMRDVFYDTAAYNASLAQSDALVYAYYDLGIPKDHNEVAFGTSIIYPGKIGSEYYMTKGHLHAVLETAEVYFCLRGHGYVLMENPEGACESREMTPGIAVNIPGRFAHRSVNVHASEPFVFYFAVPGHAGHNYGAIEAQGFHQLLVERDGKPVFIDNPRWKSTRSVL